MQGAPGHLYRLPPLGTIPVIAFVCIIVECLRLAVPRLVYAIGSKLSDTASK